MSSLNTIPIDKLARLVGTPNCPVLVDVRTEDDFKANPRLIPSSMRRPYADAPDWAGDVCTENPVGIDPATESRNVTRQ